MITIKRPLSAAVIPAALLSTAGFAQEATVVPPPVVSTNPAPAPAAPVITPPPVVSTSPAPTVMAEPTPTVEEVAPSPEPAARSVRRSVPSRAAAPVAPAATAIAAAPTAPVAEAPPVSAGPVAAAPAPAQTTPETTTVDAAAPEAANSDGVSWLPFAAIAAALAAVIGFFVLRRRRREDEYYYEEAADEAPVETAYNEPGFAAAPAMAADPEPVANQDYAHVVAADADEVAAIAATDAPASRPWIELSFRPVRAGAGPESAQVDLELTLGNAGSVAAEDVRVSTFMLGDGASAPTEMERLLATGQNVTEVSAGSIAPGEGSRVDASLSVPRHDRNDDGVQPVVVADVRYRLPDGSEGRTAASFLVGATEDGATLDPLPTDGALYESVGAALHGELERA